MEVHVSVWVCVGIHMHARAHTHVETRSWHQVSFYSANDLVYWDRSFSWIQRSLIWLVWLAVLTWGSSVVVSLVLGLEADCYVHLAFTWVLEIWTPGLMFAQHALAPLNHFPSLKHIYYLVNGYLDLHLSLGDRKPSHYISPWAFSQKGSLCADCDG